MGVLKHDCHQRKLVLLITCEIKSVTLQFSEINLNSVVIFHNK